MSAEHPELASVAPEFAQELARALRAEDLPDLAESVHSLRVVRLCGCGDDFCHSFYTGPAPATSWPDEGDHECVTPEMDRGQVILDVVDDRIRYVEVLFRPDVGKLFTNGPKPG